MCQSVRNRSLYDFVISPKESTQIIVDLKLTSFTIKDSDMVLLHKKRSLVLNKIIASGIAKLEISIKSF